MTDNALRKALTDKMSEQGWGYNELYADMANVVGTHVTPSSATLRRFIERQRATRKRHLHFIKQYVDQLSSKAAVA